MTTAISIISFFPINNSLSSRTVTGTFIEFKYYGKIVDPKNNANQYDVYRALVNLTGTNGTTEFFMYFGADNTTFPVAGKTYRFTYENFDIENIYHVYNFIEL